ncbi:UDP-3-O-(3-hydroxymyristoyl)glucosamine N-acyltransferase [Pelagibacterales bacterium]|nr:UDP-3-O-(3-hydroxymyristoyl)glucosamine N-acyltransferase [Pelagibacterales bacterium]
MFYHSNFDICITDILNLCDIKSDNTYQNIKIGSFIRADIASKNDITFVNSNRYSVNTKAMFVVTSKKLSNLFNKDQFVLISNNLDCDIARISNLFYRDKTTKEILSLPEAITGTSSDVSINSIIGNGVIIGDNFSMDSFSSIGHNCTIGNNVKIGKNVAISNSLIGDNVTIGDGTKVGQTGFGFTYDTDNNPLKIYHIGRVIIQNNVNINSNCTIDRGSFNDTIIGENTFIDNLVHIAHNVTIGNNCMIAGQCGFAGSAKIGNFVQIGGQTGIGGHIKISDFVKIAAKSGVIRDIAKGETVMGYPAINLNKYLKNYKKSMM